MTPLDGVRRNFIIVLAVLLAVNLALAAYLLWPGRPNVGQQLVQEDNLRQEFKKITRQVEPLQGMDEKLIKTRADVKTFYDQHVARRWSEVSEEINKLAKENGLPALPVRYRTDETGLPDLQRIEIDIGAPADYAKIARFINAMERDKLIFVITEIVLSGQQGGSAVDLRIKVETFLKEPT
jgi:Tfp pilus assembly protein PilO